MRLTRWTRPRRAPPAQANAAAVPGTGTRTGVPMAKIGILPASRRRLGRLLAAAGPTALQGRLEACRSARPEAARPGDPPSGDQDSDWAAGQAGQGHQPPSVSLRQAQAGSSRPGLIVPAGLEECGWGLIDWRGLPGHVAIGLLRAADRIAREGHAVAFTGQEYQAGPELKIDGHLTVIRYLSGQPGAAVTPDAARDLLASALADARAAPRIAVVCEQPDLSKQDASQVIAGLQHRPGPAGTGGVDIYGYGWTVHQ